MATSNTGASNIRQQTRHPPEGPISPPVTEHQPTIQPSPQQNRLAIQQPVQQNHPNNLPATGPITPAGSEHNQANEPQGTEPTAGGINPAIPGFAQPTVEARLECYERNGTPLASTNQPQVLFSDQETIDCIKAASAPLKDDGKKVTLPEVVPGFKASSLDVGKSPILSFMLHITSMTKFRSLIVRF